MRARGQAPQRPVVPTLGVSALAAGRAAVSRSRAGGPRRLHGPSARRPRVPAPPIFPLLPPPPPGRRRRTSSSSRVRDHRGPAARPAAGGGARVRRSLRPGLPRGWSERYGWFPPPESQVGAAVQGAADRAVAAAAERLPRHYSDARRAQARAPPGVDPSVAPPGWRSSDPRGGGRPRGAAPRASDAAAWPPGRASRRGAPAAFACPGRQRAIQPPWPARVRPSLDRRPGTSRGR